MSTIWSEFLIGKLNTLTYYYFFLILKRNISQWRLANPTWLFNEKDISFGVKLTYHFVFVSFKSKQTRKKIVRKYFKYWIKCIYLHIQNWRTSKAFHWGEWKEKLYFMKETCECKNGKPDYYIIILLHLLCFVRNAYKERFSPLVKILEKIRNRLFLFHQIKELILFYAIVKQTIISVHHLFSFF